MPLRSSDSSSVIPRFDEVHFGKHLSYYLTRSYFFDVHPPLAKLTLAAAGHYIGYNGSYPFATIGDDYVKAKVPYVGLRTVPAIAGSLLVPLAFAIIKECHLSTAAAVMAASMVLLGARITTLQLTLRKTTPS